MYVPDVIQYILTENDFILDDVIQHNSLKNTFVLKISKGDDNFILKSVNKTSPLKVKDKFKAEVRYYLENSNEFVPELVLATDEFLITKYIHGKTLREYLDENGCISNIVENLLQAAQTFYLNSKTDFQAPVSYKIANTYISSLARSGPIQTKNNSRFDKIVSRLITRCLKKRLGKLLRNMDCNDLMTGFSHGDFHYNNIFITNDGGIKFIDFENAVANECFDFDILYLLAMIEVKLDEESNFHKNHMISLVNKNENMIAVFDIYKTAVSINSRFCKHPVSKVKKLQLLIKLLIFK